MSGDEVQDIIAQLSQLQLQQTRLLARLQRAVVKEAEVPGRIAHEETRSEEPTIGNKVPVKDDLPKRAREFVIGDKVVIKNPNPFQTSKGTITKIGGKRITVTTQSGGKILRAPKNLALEA